MFLCTSQADANLNLAMDKLSSYLETIFFCPSVWCRFAPDQVEMCTKSCHCMDSKSPVRYIVHVGGQEERFFFVFKDLHVLNTFNKFWWRFIAPIIPHCLFQNLMLHLLNLAEVDIRSTGVSSKVFPFHHVFSYNYFGWTLTSPVVVLFTSKIHFTVSLILSILVLVVIMIIKSITTEIDLSTLPFTPDTLNHHFNTMMNTIMNSNSTEAHTKSRTVMAVLMHE